jgi:hypothetical protein
MLVFECLASRSENREGLSGFELRRLVFAWH